MKNTKLMLVVLIGLSLALNGCKKEKIDPNEGELITTVKLKLTNTLSAGAIPLVFEFKDLDGEGGAVPVKFDSVVLLKNGIYTCEVSVLNESVSPADDITAEIRTEAVDHQFYFVPSSSNLLSVSNYDTDANNLPLGLNTTWVTGLNAGTGTLRVVLKHKPSTKAANDLINKGDTDIELDFKLIIK